MRYILCLFGLWAAGVTLGVSIGVQAMIPITGNELIKSGFTIVDEQGRIVDKFDKTPFIRSYTTTTH